MKKYINKIGLNDKDSKFALNDLGVAYFKLNDIENAKILERSSKFRKYNKLE
ncbi:hypothetical protein ACQWU4_14095 [Chryseobacterium sp. MIQD13]|uniref:hypothetical protein n=1 Tax=Chryseobacterium sp. MIQD13 TaxID=3422310 RepID=UPI003D2D1C4D